MGTNHILPLIGTGISVLLGGETFMVGDDYQGNSRQKFLTLRQNL